MKLYDGDGSAEYRAIKFGTIVILSVAAALFVGIILGSLMAGAK